MSIRLIIDLRKAYIPVREGHRSVHGKVILVRPHQRNIADKRYRSRRDRRQGVPAGGGEPEKRTGVTREDVQIADPKLRRLFQQATKEPRSIKYSEFVNLLHAFGFSKARHHRSSHEQWTNPAADGILTVTEQKKGLAAHYQVKQLVKMVHRCKLKA